MYKLEKLNETFICDILGEMDIFIVRSSDTPYININDVILDIKDNTQVDVIEGFLSKIEIEYNYNSVMIKNRLDRFLYRFGSNEDSKAYRFLLKLWREEKIKRLTT